MTTMKENIRQLIDDKLTKGSEEEKQLLLDGLYTIINNYDHLLYQEALDNLYDGIYIANAEGKTLYVNDAYLQMTGLKREDVIDQYVDELLEKGVYQNAVTPKVLKYKKQVNSIGKAADGVDMLITGKPIFDENMDIKSVVVIDRDLSDLWSMKNQLEITEKKMATVEQKNLEKVNEIEHLKKRYIHSSIIGNSEEIQQVIDMSQKVAPLDVTVLITGESGVGKEVIANEVYLKSTRNDKPFVKVNCAAIPAHLMESELFGYRKGAFSGAIKDKPGLFEIANNGTIFLDEIGEIPLDLQAKLLRVIQQKEIISVGSTTVQKLDVRVLAATNSNLLELCRQGKFREDLYYRLNIVPIHILPLRKRKRDISVLINFFMNKYNKKYGKNVSIDYSGYQVLEEYKWPGNIRELKNIIERLIIISEAGVTINKTQINNVIYPNVTTENLVGDEIGLKEMLEQVEREILINVLKETKSTRNAAKKLKIDQSTVVKKVKKLGISYIDDINHRM